MKLVEYTNRLQQAVDQTLGPNTFSVNQPARTRGRNTFTENRGGYGGGSSDAYQGQFRVEADPTTAGAFRVTGGHQGRAGVAYVNGIEYNLPITGGITKPAGTSSRWYILLIANSDPATGDISLSIEGSLITGTTSGHGRGGANAILLAEISNGEIAEQIYRGQNIDINLYWEGEP